MNFLRLPTQIAEDPSSPAVGLSLMDFGMRQKDLPTLKRASEMLQKWTGGDTYVDLNVAAVMLTEGDADKAAEMSKEVDLRGFGFVNPVLLQLKIALASKDNVSLLECFRILRDDHDEDINKLLKSPVFTGITTLRVVGFDKSRLSGHYRLAGERWLGAITLSRGLVPGATMP